MRRAALVAAGCAWTEDANGEMLVTEKLPRPNHILVYNFGATPADVPADSAFAGQHSEPAKPQTAEEIATGRKLGAQIAAELVKKIRGMGMPAEQVSTGGKPQINDIVIRGYLLSIQEGSAEKAIRNRIWVRGVRVENGGRSLPDDGSGTAQTRIRQRQRGVRDFTPIDWALLVGLAAAAIPTSAVRRPTRASFGVAPSVTARGVVHTMAESACSADQVR
jgi:hypothetical protein